MSKRPLILVCNDDGVHAPGITALTEVARELGDVVVVAPNKPQSGMGHAITIESTLRIEKIKEEQGFAQYSTDGTPVDCMKLAISVVLDRKPDIVISGINHGSNASINVIYSGTMSAVVEGCLEGISSVGFSLLDHDIDADFSAAKVYAKRVIQQVLENGLPDGICLNVNIPKLKTDEIEGVKVCRQAKAYWKETFDEREDPSGRKYYWMAGVFEMKDDGGDTDIEALKKGFVTVVPVQYDMTAHNMLKQLNQWQF